MEDGQSKLALYRPLIIIFALSLVMAAGLAAGHRIAFAPALMGLFLCFLAELQMFDLPGFARAFAKYDLVAAKFPVYGRVYPFVELVLGLSYLAGTAPLATNIVMLGVMAVGTAGVARAVKSGETLQCACAGTAFVLPVGRVTIFENAVMGLMAAINIFQLLA